MILTEDQKRLARALYNMYKKSDARTPRGRFKMFERSVNDHKYTLIQQNPDTRTEWAQRAREGQEVVQLQKNGKYTGVYVDGEYWPKYQPQG